MLDNHLYDLMTQLVQESKSLKRIRQNYEDDAEGCEDCKTFWNKMIKDKEGHIDELMGLIKKHVT